MAPETVDALVLADAGLEACPQCELPAALGLVFPFSLL